MTAKEIFKKIKAAFDMPMPPAPAPTPAPGGMTMCSYLVDGGVPVYIDVSDDGLADIDVNDKAYTDEAMTAPYPDGTYKVTGTAFGFTVAGGVVTAVDDATNAGPGAPATGPTAMAKPAVVPPAPAPAPAPPQPVTLSAEEFAAMCAKFATGTPEDRLANLEIMCKALMECNFGYEIRKGQESQAIQVYKESLTPVQTAVTAAATQLQAASEKIEAQQATITKHEQTLTGIFELVEKLVELPTADPATLTGRKKEQFDKQKSKEEKFETIAAAITAMKKQHN